MTSAQMSKRGTASGKKKIYAYRFQISTNRCRYIWFGALLWWNRFYGEKRPSRVPSDFWRASQKRIIRFGSRRKSAWIVRPAITVLLESAKKSGVGPPRG